jgi:hypothetical protein
MKSQHKQILEKPVSLKCHRCGNDWTYKGKNPYYACCTYCKAIVNIRKQKVIDQDSTHSQLPSGKITTASATTTIVTDEEQHPHLIIDDKGEDGIDDDSSRGGGLSQHYDEQ